MAPLYRMWGGFEFTSFQIFLANVVPIRHLVRDGILPLQAIE